jgi:hypothetical protein
MNSISKEESFFLKEELRKIRKESRLQSIHKDPIMKKYRKGYDPLHVDGPNLGEDWQ